MSDAESDIESTNDIGILSLFTQLGLTRSNSQALSLLKQGGLYLNNKRITDNRLVVPETMLRPGTLIILRVGKRQRQAFLVVEAEDEVETEFQTNLSKP